MTTRRYLVVHGLPIVFSSPEPVHHARLAEDYGGFFVDSEPPGELMTYTVDVSGPATGGVAFDGSLGDEVVVSSAGVGVFGPNIADPKAYEAEVRAYFTAMVLSELTRRRTGNLFHSSAVRGERGAVVFGGAKKMGKSTMAMLCSLNGAQYVSQDMTMLAVAGDAVTVMGLPQPITLAPGARSWFARRHPGSGVDTQGVDQELDAASLYILEVGDKHRFTRERLERYTSVCHEESALGSLVFPEPNLTLSKPRARLLDRAEATARLAMLAETFLKWHWPTPLGAEEYLDRVRLLVLSAVDSVPAWHFQWCPDHDLNYELLKDIAL